MIRRSIRRSSLGWLPFVAILLLSCSIKPPEVTITGEKTALERQLLGEHRRLPEEVWSVGAVNTSSIIPPGLSDSLEIPLTGEAETTLVEEYSPGRLRYLRAEASRIFNQDDVEDFKKRGVVGENNRGYLEVVDSTALGGEPALASLVARVLPEENRSRRVIMEWYVSLRQDLTEEDLPTVEASFAEHNRERASPGEFIQDREGSWKRK
jgi:uncharacterized protein YdbL (DUF1318 family)